MHPHDIVHFYFRAGVVTSTVTSPIWVVKTQMQLECSRLTAQRCVKQIFKMDGIRGFYRGLTASYAGECGYYTTDLFVLMHVLSMCISA